MPVAGSRVGVFGGTFDPPHRGHVQMALEIRTELDLDRVLLVVANEPWQKVDERPVSAASDRLAMVRAAVEGTAGLEACDLETRRGGLTYTIDTLDELAELYPDDELFVILGHDAAAGLDTWVRADELARRATIVVIARPGMASLPLPEGFRYRRVGTVGPDVSSTEVRRRVRESEDISGLVPGPVATCIDDRGLYRGTHDG